MSLDGGGERTPGEAAGGRATGVAAFAWARVERPSALPAAETHTVDVALLDMNHGYPNLGHDSLVDAVRETAGEAEGPLSAAGLRVRVLSFDVRRSGLLPEPPGDRYSLYLGSGGPGHVDPRGNDGASAASQGVREDPAWEAPAFRLFDAIRADPEAALLGVCHTFGVLCRWSGAAAPVLRSPAKGKAAGVLENVLSPAAAEHPWFAAFGSRLRPDRRFSVVENRLFDLLPTCEAPAWATPLAFETGSGPGGVGAAVTMMEFARDGGGVVPRLFAVNHHPEIHERERQRAILEAKRARGEVSEEWCRERRELLDAARADDGVERGLRLTSAFTLLGPLRFHLLRAIRRRAEALGQPFPLDERRVVETTIGRGR